MGTDDAESGRILDDETVARRTERRPIEAVAGDLGLGADDVEPMGDGKAKLTHDAVRRAVAGEQDGRLVLVTAMTPTPAGEGKTVTTIGLAQSLDARGATSVAAVREPSLGPVFGIKGGATGGGRAQVLPPTDVNLHFTGDMHAVTAAHNLVAAALDNRLHHGDDLGVDVDEVRWPRVLDVDDRALRNVVVGLGPGTDGVPRESEFVITAASELMAALCLATDLDDLRRRVGRAVVAREGGGEPVVVDDLGVTGAATALLRDAFRPNLVQTVSGTPAFVHGGPFANIAHGTNSLVADRVGLSLAEYVVTEAGFGADLGAEKFLDIVAREGPTPDAVVLVASVRALRHHGEAAAEGGLDGTNDENGESDKNDDLATLRAGFPNLDHHVETLRRFGAEPVVAINRFPDDGDAEVAAVREHCRDRGVAVAVSTVYRDGPAGGEELARAVEAAADGPAEPSPLYDVEASLATKLETVATEVYGADGVEFVDGASEDLDRLARDGFDDFPVCVSKVPGSLSDDPERLGVPEDWTLSVKRLYPAAGAGFVVALTADVLTMPGLPAEPAAEDVDVESDGTVTGV
ncbi:MAG: formate--tetrahydrofolate ligase [Halolamina sp.]